MYYGIVFQSKTEGDRYLVLLDREKRGEISQLQRQVPFVVIPKAPGQRETKYLADFVYMQNGKRVVEDVKGVRTQVYLLKKKLMYTVHGIQIKEVKKADAI
jgi:hypothetical protein